jgi:superoxide dismutase, Cu-Zn family
LKNQHTLILNKMKTKIFFLLKVLFVAVTSIITFSAKGQMDPKMHANMSKMAEAKVEKAICVLYPTKDSKVTGKVVFIKTDAGIKVIANIEGLTEGNHGFHIHACGDCSSEDGMSAGGHFNPDNKMHGAPVDSMRHAGDMGNIVADKSGKAHLEFTDKDISLEGPHSIIGRSVIVHKNADDLKTQPTGNAGARVACGVIGIAANK